MIDDRQPCRPSAQVAHLWHAEISLDATALAMLTDTERTQAAKLRAGLVRSQYIAARSMTRSILAHYADVEPGELRWTRSTDGKPAIAADQNRHDLRFSLAHAQRHLVLAVTIGSEIGVDVETVRPMQFADAMTDHFMTPDEQCEYQSVGADRQPEHFYYLWTRKEAVIKAVGIGLKYPLTSLDVRSDRVTTQNHDHTDCWQLRTYHPANGILAAVAADVAIRAWHHFKFPPADASTNDCVSDSNRSVRLVTA